ncbi:MAG TPA: SIMPL domain-containing protein [Terriglobales bacterium]|nr:SIMPL domain-containing protein [Terriglobales bacterium]
MKLRLLLTLLVTPVLPVLTHARQSQGPDIKFIADTLVVQADGTYEADPDLATLTFDVSAQDKDLKQTYAQASGAIQKIIALAEKNRLQSQDISSGVLTVRPFYEGDRKRKARSYWVHGEVSLKLRDFSKLGPIFEGSVEDGITDFRSLTYSLSDEEAAKQKAVAEAMKRAIGRASAALSQNGQKIGSLRFANLDVKQLTGLSSMNIYSLSQYAVASTLETQAPSGGGWGWGAKKAAPPPPPPIPQPEKIAVSATVQCAFQIQ